jgi:Fe2+ or Zn2+ uptake regulation protein
MSGHPDTNDGTEPEDTEQSFEERISEIRDKDKLTRLFRPSNAKIIAVLSISPRDMSATQISEQAGIDPSTFYENRDFLLEQNIIEKTRKTGQSPMYDLSDSETGRLVAKLRGSLY